MHCRPRHSPRIGIWFSRAYRTAPTLPSTPRMPKPPGITDAVDVAAAPGPHPPAVWQVSEGTQRTITLARLAKPPARSASQTER